MATASMIEPPSSTFCTLVRRGRRPLGPAPPLVGGRLAPPAEVVAELRAVRSGTRRCGGWRRGACEDDAPSRPLLPGSGRGRLNVSGGSAGTGRGYRPRGSRQRSPLATSARPARVRTETRALTRWLGEWTHAFASGAFGSRGRPNTFSPTMFRWIWLVPPQMVSERLKKNDDIIGLTG